MEITHELGGAMTYPPERRRDLACFSGDRKWEAEEGLPSPLGVSYVEEDDQFNFGLYSKHATGVDLLLFAADDCISPVHVVTLIWSRHKSGRIWHCRLPAALVRRAAYYAY
jgi:glycogen operon protein